MADMLDTPLGRRIVAAAALRGWERKDLPDHFASYGDRVKFTPSRLARDPDAQPTQLHLDMLSSVFGLPSAWFTEPDLAALIPGATVTPNEADEPTLEQVEQETRRQAGEGGDDEQRKTG